MEPNGNDGLYQKRDILLAEMHSDLKHLVEWTKAHEARDDKRFEEIDRKLLWGAISVLVVAGATGVIPALVAQTAKIGG